MESIEGFPDIDVHWDDLNDAATDLGTKADIAKSYLTDAQTAWTGVRDAYRHDETQSTVHAALDDLTTPVAEWATALSSAKTALEDFVTTGRPLQRESEALADLLPGLRSQVRSDPEGEKAATTSELSDFNRRARALSTEWDTAQTTAADALDAITQGTGDSLPTSAPLGGTTLPTVSWADFTSGLDEDFGAVDPRDLLPSLRGLSPEELRAWADANPEAAAILAANRPMGPFMPGSPEQAMAAVMGGDAPLTASGIKRIRSTWLGLEPGDQEKLLLLYPAVFGNLNGVPLAQRATANIVTVAGLREQVRNRQVAPGPEPDINDYTAEAFSEPGNDRVRAYSAYGDYQEAHRRWEESKAAYDALVRQAAGLDYAMDHDTQVVMVSLDGDGRIVTMKGAPSSSTSTVSTLVPGTGADLGSLEDYTGKLDAIDGTAGGDRVSFYWQGTDLPNEIPDNVTSRYNEDGGPLLAAFDHALDAEVPLDARSTYVGYSAGGSLLGTGEREGLDSTNVVYVAPAGVGHEVGSPSDTANPEANRYWIQTRDDPIAYAQAFGGGYHGPSFWEGSNPQQQMGAIRLESGFKDPSDPGSVIGGHTDYFWDGSTAATNINGVIEGTTVSPFVDYEHHYGFGYSSTESPLEERPEDFAYGKLETVSTGSLEK